MSEYYHSGGARLGFSDIGSGVPVVFLHPTPIDREFWRPLRRHLSHVRAIVPDFRGHGVSELGTDLPVGGFSRVPDAPVLTMVQLGSDILALSIIFNCTLRFLPAARSGDMYFSNSGAKLRSGCAA